MSVLIEVGETGSGMAAGVLRPIYAEWLRRHRGGALVLDGMGSLPTNMPPSGYTIIELGVKLTLVGELSVDDVVEAIAATRQRLSTRRKTLLADAVHDATHSTLLTGEQP